MSGTKEWTIFSKLELKDKDWKNAINHAKKINLTLLQTYMVKKL